MWVEGDGNMCRSSNISGVTHEIKIKLIESVLEKRNLKILTLVKINRTLNRFICTS